MKENFYHNNDPIDSTMEKVRYEIPSFLDLYFIRIKK